MIVRFFLFQNSQIAREAWSFCHRWFQKLSLLGSSFLKFLTLFGDNILLFLWIIKIFYSLIDIELFYCSLGYMETPPKPPQFGVNCNFSWEHTFIPGNYGSSEIEEIPNLISHVCIVVRFIITTLTVLTILLIWWYTGHPVQTAIIICIIFSLFFFWQKK